MRILLAFKTKRCLIFVPLMLAGTMMLCSAQTVKLADLEAGLRDAMVRDAQCPPAEAAAKSDKGNANPGGPDVSRDSLLQTPVSTLPLHGAGGTTVGVIVAPREGCHCQNGNCTTYVYLKAQDGYRLALKQDFASLHAMKSYKHGMPSLTGRHAVSSSVYETAVFDWDGAEYQATLCAKVTQGKDPRRPAIVKQECRKQ